MERDSLLSSIDRRRLDFDFEKVCSVTLAQTNVYVCLTCGRYLQGRSPNSPAHQHSLQTEHSLFLQLDTKRVYHLPDNVEFDDPSLSDIRVHLIGKGFKL
jgi:U4/U6.U5 tri-snRNP-associated protein 2